MDQILIFTVLQQMHVYGKKSKNYLTQCGSCDATKYRNTQSGHYVKFPMQYQGACLKLLETFEGLP